MSRISQQPLANLLRDLKRERKRAAIQPVPPDESAQQASWLDAPTFQAGESTDPGDPLGQLRPADAIRNQEQKKTLTPDRELLQQLPQKVATEVVAALAASIEPTQPDASVAPKPQLWGGRVTALGERIVDEHRAE